MCTRLRPKISRYLHFKNLPEMIVTARRPVAFTQAFPVPLSLPSLASFLKNSNKNQGTTQTARACVCVLAGGGDEALGQSTDCLPVIELVRKGKTHTQWNRFSCAEAEMQNPTATTLSRACTLGDGAKLFLHSFYWQLLLKVTHISRGAEFQEEKKPCFLCNFSL